MGAEGKAVFNVEANTQDAQKNVESFDQTMKALADSVVQANDKLAASRTELKGLTDQLKVIEQARTGQAVTPDIFQRYLQARDIDLPALQKRAAELKNNIVLEGELAAAAQRRLRQAQVTQERAAIVPGAVEEKGLLEQLESFSSGRRRGFEGLLAGLGRGGLLGAGIIAGYQALDKVREMLKTTGAEALTTQGRLRNVGSALLGGDILGGVEALTAQAKTVEELGVNSDNARAKLDAFRQIMSGQQKTARDAAVATAGAAAANEDLDKSVGPVAISYGRAASQAKAAADANSAYRKSADEAGTSNQFLAEQAAAVAEELIRQRNAAISATAALVQFRDQAGVPIPFQGLGPLKPGAVTPEQFMEQPGVTADYGPGPYGRRQAALAEAQRQGNLAEVARVTAQNVATARYRYNQALEFASRPGMNKAQQDALRGFVAKRRQELEAALDAADSAQDAVDAENKAKREKATAERKAKDEKAARDYRDALDTREQNLRNAYQHALQTPGARDDRSAYRELRAFLVGEGRDPKLTPGERAGFRGEVVALTGQRAQDIEQADAAADKVIRDRQATQEQRLKNRVAAAELTKKNIRDDLKALRDLRDFYRRSAKDKKDIYTDLEQRQFEYAAIETQQKIKDLLSKKGTAEDQAKTAASLLAETQRILREFSGNVMAGNTPGTVPATVVVNQNFKAPTPDRMREARLAAFAARTQFV